MNRVIPTLSYMALAMAPMFIFANDIDFNEYRNTVVGLAFGGCGFAMTQIGKTWRPSKSLDDVN